MNGSGRPDHGEARIARAFRRSLLTLGVIALLGVGAYLWRARAPEAPAASQAPAAAPRLPEPEPGRAPPTVRFSDITEASGIHFRHVNGARGARLLPETMGSGAAFFDYDGDGDPDLFLCNGMPWPGDPGNGAPATPALYRNDGHGHFEDVTQASGLAASLYGMGVAAADFDGDGDLDLFLTAVGPNHLYRNDAGVFTDVTASAGVAGDTDAWSTSSAFLDYDGDGDLDLFVANYVRWSQEIDREVDFRLTGIGRAYGPPTAFRGSHSYLYRNEGDGRYTDVSTEAGIQVANPATGEPIGKALGITPVDIDSDGRLDLLVANDTVQNFLFHNLGEGRFEEVGTLYGVAFDRNGAATGAMGTDAAAFRNDADLGLAVANFANEMTSLYVTQGAAPPLADESIVEGIGPASRQVLSFALFFLDYDLDGRLDLFEANGHLEPEINQVQPSQHYAQPPQLFWNCATGCREGFVPVPAEGSGDLARPLIARGASYADIDADGDLDLLITQNGRRAVLLRNDQDLGHHWLRVRLVGRPPNTHAVGARVTLSAGGAAQRRTLMPTRGYLSQVELPLTFGLGESTRAQTLRVTWPDGSSQSVEDPPVDRLITVRQAARGPE